MFKVTFYLQVRSHQLNLPSSRSKRVLSFYIILNMCLPPFLFFSFLLYEPWNVKSWITTQHIANTKTWRWKCTSLMCNCISYQSIVYAILGYVVVVHQPVWFCGLPTQCKDLYLIHAWYAAVSIISSSTLHASIVYRLKEEGRGTKWWRSHMLFVMSEL